MNNEQKLLQINEIIRQENLELKAQINHLYNEYERVNRELFTDHGKSINRLMNEHFDSRLDELTLALSKLDVAIKQLENYVYNSNIYEDDELDSFYEEELDIFSK